ncbi:MAG TPA: hypothetical protein VL859_04200, partial [Flavobacterium sp.]|nr:hypothetical protein [Flavobacterium sp.]
IPINTKGKDKARILNPFELDLYSFSSVIFYIVSFLRVPKILPPTSIYTQFFTHLLSIYSK